MNLQVCGHHLEMHRHFGFLVQLVYRQDHIDVYDVVKMAGDPLELASDVVA